MFSEDLGKFGDEFVFLYQNNAIMTTIKLTINEKTGSGKHLLALIKEIAKLDNEIVVENFYEPNRETLKAIKDVDSGYVTMASSVDELFDSI
jgi:hypothetical protein